MIDVCIGLLQQNDTNLHWNVKVILPAAQAAFRYITGSRILHFFFPPSPRLGNKRRKRKRTERVKKKKDAQCSLHEKIKKKTCATKRLNFYTLFFFFFFWHEWSDKLLSLNSIRIPNWGNSCEFETKCHNADGTSLLCAEGLNSNLCLYLGIVHPFHLLYFIPFEPLRLDCKIVRLETISQLTFLPP